MSFPLRSRGPLSRSSTVLVVAACLAALAWRWAGRADETELAAVARSDRDTQHADPGGAIALRAGAPGSDDRDAGPEDGGTQPLEVSGPAEAVALIADALDAGVSDAGRYPQLARCAARHGMGAAECAPLLNPAARRTLTLSIAGELSAGDRFGVPSLLRQLGGDAAARAAHELAERTLLQSGDPLERIAALALDQRLASESKVPPAALQPQCFRDLAQRTSLEARYLLHALEQSPQSDPAVAREVAKVALSQAVDVDERRLAFRALGEAGAREAIDQILETASRTGGLSFEGAIESVGPGLARCGVACEASMRRLAAERSPNDRLAVLVALANTDDATFAELGDSIVSMVADARDRGAIEEDQLDFVRRRLKAAGAAHPAE